MFPSFHWLKAEDFVSLSSLRSCCSCVTLSGFRSLNIGHLRTISRKPFEDFCEWAQTNFKSCIHTIFFWPFMWNTKSILWSFMLCLIWLTFLTCLGFTYFFFLWRTAGSLIMFSTSSMTVSTEHLGVFCFFVAVIFIVMLNYLVWKLLNFWSVFCRIYNREANLKANAQKCDENNVFVCSLGGESTAVYICSLELS